MAINKREIATREFNFAPTTLEEAQKYATIIANSGICPEGFRGKPNDVLIVLQMGSELGLKPMQSLRALGSINGMPFAYGDGLLALVKRHGQFDDMKEWFEGDIEKGTLTAYCTMIRKGKEPVTRKFDMEDAKRAALWGKNVWAKYPRRMLGHRARGYAARDAFPDALFGLMSEEEARSVAEPVNEIDSSAPRGKGMSGLEASLGINASTIIEGEIVGDIQEVNETPALSGLDELKDLISRLNVKKKSIDTALEKFGVASIDELTDEMIEKWSSHLKIKESK